MFNDKKFFEIYNMLLKEGISSYSSPSTCRLGLDFGTSFTKVAYLFNGDSGMITFKVTDPNFK